MTIETISPPLEAERQDVRAHLIGGVPVSDVEALAPLFGSVGLDPAVLFVPATEPSQLSLFDQRPEPLVDEAYYAFRQELTDRRDLARAVAGDVAVVARRKALEAAGRCWWRSAMAQVDRARRQPAARLRAALMEGLATAVAPVGLLDAPAVHAAGEGWWAALGPELVLLRAQGTYAAVERGLWAEGGDAPCLTGDEGEAGARGRVLGRWEAHLLEALDARAAARIDEVVAAVEHLWDKYHTSLRTLEIRRSELKARLDGLLRELGYV